MHEPDGDLALERWGTRFASPTVEATFREWRFVRAIPQLRILCFAGLALVVVVPLTWPTPPGMTASAIAAFLAGWYFFPVLALVAVVRRDARLWRATWRGGFAVFAANLVWGTYQNRAVDNGINAIFVAMSGAVILAASADGASAAPGAFVLAAGGQALRVARFFEGGLGVRDLAYETVNIWIFVSIGVIAALGNERAARIGYRQEQLIARQRETIAKQQALLEKELSHQVAERSRELGNVLAKSDVTLDVRALREGERFAERYRIVRALGAGGMGAVYEVERVTDQQRLALKCVVGEVSGAAAARFAREAEIGARLRHPNVISIVDVGVASGVPYLAMDLVEGGSLEAQRVKFGDVPWALPILRQITEGLAALHDAGVVHRDLKPANVLLDGGTPRISDFGISRFGAIDDSSVDARGATLAATPKKSAELTGTGVVMGTPLYMAPEGVRSARALDGSADVFALGIIAYEMLTGKSPFGVPAFVLALGEQAIPAPPPIDDPRVPGALRTAVQGALVGDPSQRPRARAVLAAFSTP